MFINNYFNRLSLLQIDFTIWSGYAIYNKTTEKKSQLKCGERIKLINHSHFKPFNRLKTKTRRICLAHGMPFLNGFVVPTEKVDVINSELELIDEEMREAKKYFISKYDDYLQEMILNCCCSTHIEELKESKLSKDIIKEKLNFNHVMIKIVPSNQKHEHKINEQINNLGQELFDEAVRESKQFYNKNLKDKISCHINTKKTLLRLRDKINGLSFLEDKLKTVSALIDSALYNYNHTGSALIGEQRKKVMKAIRTLLSEDEIIEYGKLIDKQASKQASKQAKIGRAHV